MQQTLTAAWHGAQPPTPTDHATGWPIDDCNFPDVSDAPCLHANKARIAAQLLLNSTYTALKGCCGMLKGWNFPGG